MRTALDCIPCFARQTLEAARFARAEAIAAALEDRFEAVDLVERTFFEEFPGLMDLVRNIKRTGARGRGVSGLNALARREIGLMEKRIKEEHGSVRNTHHIYFIKSRCRL